jgi:predicted transposase YbfD/YdcC
MLAGIRDPRDPRGVRHRLVAVLGVAVAATPAGAANYREPGSVAADLPQELLRLPGACWDRARRRFAAPSAATLRRVLIALDADELDAAVGAWLRTHATCDADGWAVALDGKDPRGSWDDDGRLVLLAAMTHRAPGQDAVVPGQVAVPEGTTETTQVRTLLDPIDITGALVTADAAHTCAGTARYLVEDCGADHLLTIKGNRPALPAAAIATGRELIAAEPDHVTEERGHGQISRRTTWAADTGEGLGLPYAARLALIRRDIADPAGQPLSKEIAFVVTSRAHLPAGEISAHTRQHWGIENLVHRPRDTVRREDDHHAYRGNGPRITATFRNLALGLFATHGITKIKQTAQAIGRNPTRAIPLLT